MGIIFNIQKFCLHDGDGIRTCVFLKGCPLKCIWCHNPEGLEKNSVLSFNKRKCTLCGKCVEACSARRIVDGVIEIHRENCNACGKCVEACFSDANEIIGREMTAQEVIDEALKDKMFYEASGGGITVTGGEPSFQPEFALELLELAKKAGISAAIETSGIGSFEFYERAAELGVTFLFDVKCVDPLRHKKLVGVDNAHIFAVLRFLMDKGADIIIRMPLVPDCNDSDEDIAALARALNEWEGKYRYAEIMPYHTLGVGKAEKTGVSSQYARHSATDEEIERWCSIFSSYGTEVRVSK